MFGTLTYEGGGWILHMIRMRMGNDLFFQFLKTYPQIFAGKTVTTAAFFQFIEWFTGDDWTGFRQQWVERTGTPDYTLYWIPVENQLSIRLCSNRPTQGYDIDIPLHIEDAAGNRGDAVVNIKPGSQQYDFMFQTPFIPAILTVDPQEVLLDNIQPQAVSALPECTVSQVPLTTPEAQ